MDTIGRLKVLLEGSDLASAMTRWADWWGKQGPKLLKEYQDMMDGMDMLVVRSKYMPAVVKGEEAEDNPMPRKVRCMMVEFRFGSRGHPRQTL
jgi:hypothetical protein